QEGAARIDAHCAVPGLDGDIFNLVAIGPLWRAGVVDEDVQSAIAAQHLFDHAPGIRLDTDITERRDRDAAMAYDLLHEAFDAAPRSVHIAFDIVLVGDPCRHDIGNDDDYPGSRECPRCRIADPDRLAASGDQCDASGVCHSLLLLSSSAESLPA